MGARTGFLHNQSMPIQLCPSLLEGRSLRIGPLEPIPRLDLPHQFLAVRQPRPEHTFCARTHRPGSVVDNHTFTDRRGEHDPVAFQVKGLAGAAPKHGDHKRSGSPALDRRRRGALQDPASGLRRQRRILLPGPGLAPCRVDRLALLVNPQAERGAGRRVRRQQPGIFVIVDAPALPVWQRNPQGEAPGTEAPPGQVIPAGSGRRWCGTGCGRRAGGRRCRCWRWRWRGGAGREN
jgi:hypothetical protein